MPDVLAPNPDLIDASGKVLTTGRVLVQRNSASVAIAVGATTEATAVKIVDICTLGLDNHKAYEFEIYIPAWQTSNSTNPFIEWALYDEFAVSSMGKLGQSRAPALNSDTGPVWLYGLVGGGGIPSVLDPLGLRAFTPGAATVQAGDGSGAGIYFPILSAIYQLV